MLRTLTIGGLALALIAALAASTVAQTATNPAPPVPASTSGTILSGPVAEKAPASAAHSAPQTSLDFMSMLFVFMLATFIGIGVIRRVSRLLHTPLMSLTNAISAIAVVGSIMVAGGMRDYPVWIRTLGAIALFCSMTNIISGFLITDRMLKMFKTRAGGKP
jgi:NAD(P) transhydrogenase subunit alpha